MNTELKPGMMALVIGATNVTINTGKIVEIDSFIKAGDKLPSGNYAGIDCILAYGDGLAVFSTTSKAVEKRNYGLFLASQLMPIKPQSDPLHTKEEQHASS